MSEEIIHIDAADLIGKPIGTTEQSGGFVGQPAPRIVYALVSGDYSDYGVHAIYSTYEAAATQAARYNAMPRRDRPSMLNMDECEIQPFMMDSTPEQLDAKGGIEVHTDEAGNVFEPASHQRGHTNNPFAAPREYWAWRSEAPHVRAFVGYGLDFERARRAADEFRCMVLMTEQADA